MGWKDSIFEENYLDDPLSKKYGLLKNNGVDMYFFYLLFRGKKLSL